jgi:hypothetical protein
MRDPVLVQHEHVEPVALALGPAPSTQQWYAFCAYMCTRYAGVIEPIRPFDFACVALEACSRSLSFTVRELCTDSACKLHKGFDFSPVRRPAGRPTVPSGAQQGGRYAKFGAGGCLSRHASVQRSHTPLNGLRGGNRHAGFAAGWRGDGCLTRHASSAHHAIASGVVTGMPGGCKGLRTQGATAGTRLSMGQLRAPLDGLGGGEGARHGCKGMRTEGA